MIRDAALELLLIAQSNEKNEILIKEEVWSPGLISQSFSMPLTAGGPATDGKPPALNPIIIISCDRDLALFFKKSKFCEHRQADLLHTTAWHN